MSSIASAQVALDSKPLSDSSALVAPSLLEKELRKIEILGNTQVSSAVLSAAVQSFIGKKISASDVEEMRVILTKVYVDAGYINSGAVFVMPTDRQTDRLQFHIVEGRLLELRVKGQKDLNPRYLETRLRAADEVLNMNLLRERFQLLLQDPLFERIQSRLLPSGKLGEAVLELEVTRKPSYSWSIFANNYRTPAIGEAVLGGAFTARNLTGNGDNVDLQIAKSSGAAPYHLAWNLPLPQPEQALSLSWDRGRSAVVEAPLDTVDIHSRTSALEMKWTYAAVNQLARRVDLSTSFVRKFTHNSLLGEDFSFSPGEVNGRSSVQALKFSQDWSERAEQFGWLARSQFVVGKTHALPIDDASASPSGNTSFQKDVPRQHYLLWNGQTNYLRPISSWGASFLVRGQWQWSNAKLLPMEKASLGGSATVRGVRESSLLRDQMQLLSFELQKNFSGLSENYKNLQLTPLIFVDIGRAQNKGEAWQNLSSYGFGLRLQNGAWQAELTKARQLHKSLHISAEKSTLQDSGVQMQVMYKFN